MRRGKLWLHRACKLVSLDRARPCNICWSGCKSSTFAALLVLLAVTSTAADGGTSAEVRMTRQAQEVVDDLRGRLGITAPVQVTLVDSEPRVMSVRASGDRRGSFELAIEREFAATLPAVQLEAALAHELGHVWISTNHPYLQTEQLANKVAMRVVTRERLVEVYRTVWGAHAVQGGLETFLGLSTVNSAAGAR